MSDTRSQIGDGPRVGDPMPGGMWLGGTFCAPGLFQFVGYGEPGTIMEGCEIYEPRVVEMTADTTAFTELLLRCDSGPTVDWLADE